MQREGRARTVREGRRYPGSKTVYRMPVPVPGTAFTGIAPSTIQSRYFFAVPDLSSSAAKIRGDCLALAAAPILLRPYPEDESIGFLSPSRGSIFIVPSVCVIRTIAGSAGAAGTSGWRAPRGRITVLPSAGAAVAGEAEGPASAGDAVPGTNGPRLSSWRLRSPSCREIVIAIALKSRNSSTSPLMSASMSRTLFSSAEIRSSGTPVPEISIIVISFSWRSSLFRRDVRCASDCAYRTLLMIPDILKGDVGFYEKLLKNSVLMHLRLETGLFFPQEISC